MVKATTVYQQRWRAAHPTYKIKDQAYSKNYYKKLKDWRAICHEFMQILL
jgi:hypothetical protein